MEHRLSGKGGERLAQSRSRCRWRAVAVPVAAGLGAHQPDRRLPLAQQRQGRFGEVQAATVAAKALTYFKFRFLRRPLVLSFQFSDLHADKKKALEERDASFKTAYSDSLTDLPNRHALTKEIEYLPMHGSLTIVDLDGLKFYNDTYGHERGDELLISFANCYQNSLGEAFKLYRIGGDEFAVLSHEGEISLIENALDDALDSMKANGFEFAGASAGSAYSYETENIANLMRLSDERMYENKRLRKLERENIRSLFQINRSL